MAYRSLAENPSEAVDDIVGSEARGFIDDEDAVRGQFGNLFLVIW